MKSITSYLCITLLAASAFAQSDVGQSNTTTYMQPSDTKTRGIVVGLVYSNLTDVQGKSSTTEARNGITTYDTQDTRNGTHVGIYGLNFGYKNNYAWKYLGFNASGTVFKGVNVSEIPSKITIYKAQGDVVYPFTDILSLSGGLNLSYFDGLNSNELKYEAGPGGEVGLQADVRGVGILVGYQALGLRIKGEYKGTNYSYSSTGEILVSGFITQVSYTF